MPHLVTSGATLKCTMGSAPSALLVGPTRGINAGSSPVATIADSKPMVNIRPFGLCVSTSNPAVAAAKGAPTPCIPTVSTQWAPGSPTVRTGNVPVLIDTAKCTCQWGGVVSIVSPGQQTPTVG